MSGGLATLLYDYIFLPIFCNGLLFYGTPFDVPDVYKHALLLGLVFYPISWVQYMYTEH
jgi:hypothetical protein